MWAQASKFMCTLKELQRKDYKISYFEQKSNFSLQSLLKHRKQKYSHIMDTVETH